MGLKQIIRQQKILESGAVEAMLELPGEPMIYSIKYSIGNRSHHAQFFRNNKWKSLLKCFFRAFMKTEVPVVLSVTFYLTPPEKEKVSARELKLEKRPAVRSFELCEYLLSFLELLMHVLINSYRQVVKIETAKFYSANPRTVFKFMRYEEHVYLQNKDPNNSKSQAGDKARQVRQSVQPKQQKHGRAKKVCNKALEGCEAATN